MLMAVFSDLENVKERTGTIRRVKMKSLRRSLAAVMSIAFIITAGFASNGVCQPTPSQGGTSKKVNQTDTSVKLEQYFQKARKELKNNASEASAQIRKAAALLKEEANQAQGRSRQWILESHQELEELGARVQQGAVKKVDDLNNAFSRAHAALADYYRQRASDSWTKKTISEMGQSLNEAALHLERAWEWSKNKADKASEATIDSAKQVSKKIAQGSGWVSTEISKSIEALEREIGKLNKDTKNHPPKGATSPVPTQRAADGP